MFVLVLVTCVVRQAAKWLDCVIQICSFLTTCLISAGTVDELVLHGLRALRDTLPNEVELTTKVKRFAFV